MAAPKIETGPRRQLRATACALLTILSFAGTTLVVPRASLAADDSTANETEAQAAMERGIAAFGKGDAATALYEYERAMRLVPQANLPYRYAAEALLQLDRPRAAITYLEKYLSINEHVSDAAAVRARIEGLRRERLPSRWKLRAELPGTKVRVDRGALQTLPIEVELAPGEHVLSSEHEGRLTVTEHVQVVGDHPEEHVLVVGAPLPVGPGLREDPAPGGPSPLLVTSLATLGVGALTLATSAVLDATLLHAKLSDLDAASARGDANLAIYKNDASSAKTGVIVGYVAGSALAVAGGALLLVWQLTRAKPATGIGAVRVGSPLAIRF